MSCAETHEYLFAFLDNELDVPLSMEIQRHLDGCPTCAREAEIERAVRKRLSAVAVEEVGPIPAFDEAQIGTLIAADGAELPAATAGAAVRRRWLMAASVGIGLFVAGAAWFGLAPKAPLFVELAAADFTHFLEEGGPLQIESSDPVELSRWLYEKTALTVVVPTLAPGLGKLVGGRKCKIDGRPAAFVVYDLDGVPASWLAVRADESLLDGLAFGRMTGAHVQTYRRDGLTVTVRCAEGMIHAAVSRASQERLIPLLSGDVHESN